VDAFEAGLKPRFYLAMMGRGRAAPPVLGNSLVPFPGPYGPG